MIDASNLEHIISSKRGLALLSDEERIQYIRSDRWVKLPQPEAIISHLNDLLTFPRRTKVPCLLIYGETDAGKSSIVQRFSKLHPLCHKSNGSSQCSVIAFDVPKDPSEKLFYQHMLEAMDFPYRYHSRDYKDWAKQTAYDLVTALDVKMMLIDEVNQILVRSPRQQFEFLGMLREIHNQLHVSIICFGTTQARTALMRDPQLASRFGSIKLEKWKKDESLRKFLATFIDVLPLRRRSELTSDRALGRIMQLTDGVTGRIFVLMQELAVEAIRGGSERIDMKLLARDELMIPLVTLKS